MLGSLIIGLATAGEPAPWHPGWVVPALTIEGRDGAQVQLPDPEGRTVILELIRSADW